MKTWIRDLQKQYELFVKFINDTVGVAVFGIYSYKNPDLVGFKALIRNNGINGALIQELLNKTAKWELVIFATGKDQFEITVEIF